MLCVDSQLTHPKVHLTLARRKPTKPRFIGIIRGLVGIARYCCFDDSIINANTAILERVFYHAVPGGFAPPRVPDLEQVIQVLSVFKREFLKYVTTTVPVSLLVYPELNYRGRKLRIYQRARDNVLGRTYGGDFGRLKSFIKHEKVMLKSKRTVPRVIQPRSPEYNVCVGRYIRHLEHRIYSIIDRMWGGPTVMKGLNCSQQGHAFSRGWSEFAHPVAVMLDAVRFDQHVSVPVLSWEHSIYLAFFPGQYRPELEWLLSMQLFNRGSIVCPDGKLTYAVNGCRASGDMNTAMGNVLIMCSAVYSLVRSLDIKARLFNNGDDCCLIVERGDVGRLRDAIHPWFEGLGFIIDVEGEVEVLEQINFCQTHPVFDGESWSMVRDPHVAISKDVTILKRWSMREYEVYLHQLGVCGLSTYGNMPVWSAFYACLERSCSDNISSGLRAHVSAPILESGLGRLSQGMSVGREITDASRASFWLAFGMSPVAQRYMEAYFSNFHPGTGALYAGFAESLIF